VTDPSRAVLEIRDLVLRFPTYRGAVRAVNGASIRVDAGESVGIVGESGSAKSVTSLMAMRLLPEGSFEVTGGSVVLCGRDILAAGENEMVNIRGRDVAMIFQEPLTALNPTRRIGQQMLEVILLHRNLSARKARDLAIQLLGDMRIADPEQVLRRYPFELSGGMRQRVLIGLAFSCEPKLIVADEATTALDVTVQRQVLHLLRAKASLLGTAILFITHDLAVASQFCDRLYVMYAGAVVEEGPTAAVLGAPVHPYTQALLNALPERVAPGERLRSIAGSVPDLTVELSGCPFAPRCAQASAVCERRPALLPTGSDGHRAACWLAAKVVQ
jgi:peptide/nickel transport system ATP-binding protein